MREQISVTGMVLMAAPVGEYDRRLVILTRGRGKITAFARGVRRPGNQLMAAAAPFVFGKFLLYEGRDAYTLAGAEVENYFREIAGDMEAACYGSYFLEMADYYGRENIDATETLRLLYQSLRALLKPSVPNRLVKPVYGLKLMEINGEYRSFLGRLNSSPCMCLAVHVWPLGGESIHSTTDQVLREGNSASGAWSRTRKDLLIKRSIPLTF